MPPADLGAKATFWVGKGEGIAAERYLAAADRIADGWLDVHALRGVDLGTPPRWNRDPKTGIEAPLAFGKTLDCANADLVGDIEYLREVNRHRHVVTLAQAYALAGRRRHAEALAEHLESWIIACPYGRGANWSSACEAARRLAHWSVAWQLVGGAGGALLERHAALREAWLRSAYEHAYFIRGWLSLHGPDLRPLVVEAASVFQAALTWPHWPQAREWCASAKRILEDASRLAFHPRLLGPLLACLVAGRANQEWFSADFEARLEALLDYVSSMMDAGGHVLMHGEGEAFGPLLASGAILFQRGDFKQKAGRLADATRWLLGADAEAAYRELDVEKTRLPVRQSFPEDGTYVMGVELDAPGEIRLVAATASLGFALSVGGRELLVDPGTYPEPGRNAWRRYFNSAAARNGLRVDALEPARAPSGCSLWLSSAQKDIFEGWRDGYLGLGDPVKHRRLIELDKLARRLVIEDTLEMEEDHQVELYFHCHEDCVVEPLESGFLIVRGTRRLQLALPQASGARSLVYRGSLVPIAGWVSRGFDQRVPAATLVWQARLAGRSVLRTEIAITQE
ncbi:MAG TPA: heparinase II/III family protein [Burkholderiales bacterium]|nr:heparinase II/III family protein [Burkholderiales bacterium]